ncbi:MAG: hypothetical protein Q4Q03_07325, partial [Bowdeniella nasicola]|nr:hypothetical protein [Bowdeniella nasicola]
YLLGHNIGYSASPAMMHAAFAALGMDHRYELRDCPSEDLAGVLDELRASGGGANVTVPHKIAAARACDRLSDAAAQLGAINTIEVVDGELVGHNTDYFAIINEIATLVMARLERGGNQGGAAISSAAILGNGGAARAVKQVLDDAGIAVDILARSTGTWDRIDEVVPQVDLLVNATPIGTESRELPIAQELLRADLSVFDLVYRPTPTALVAKARAAGAIARGGAHMLASQGARAFEIWLGETAPEAVMYEAVLTEVGANDV